MAAKMVDPKRPKHQQDQGPNNAIFAAGGLPN